MEMIIPFNEPILHGCKYIGEYGALISQEYMREENKKVLNNCGMLYATLNSDIELYWQCKYGHVWLETPKIRYEKKTTCPDCKVVNDAWEEAIKINKIYDSFVNKNGTDKEITTDVLRQLKEKYTYKELEKITGKSVSTIKRILKGDKIFKHTLVDWCIDNNRLDLVEQWDFERNLLELGKTMRTAVNNGNAYWLCPKHNESYLCRVDAKKKYLGTTNCIKCKQEKSLQTRIDRAGSLREWCINNSDYGQHLLSEFNSNKNRDMDTYTFNSKEKIYWICHNGHEWEQNIYVRTLRKSGRCPKCIMQERVDEKIKEYGTLREWCKANKPLGDILLSEWDEQRNWEELNQTLDTVHKGSGDAYWICPNGHSYTQKIIHRTLRNCGCTQCSTVGTSYPEQFIYWSLKQIYTDAESRCKVLKSNENPRGIEFDIGIPSIPLCIEYSPTCWHAGKEDKDNYKKEICKQYGVRFIQIVEDSYNEFLEEWGMDYICFKMKVDKQDLLLEKIVEHVLQSLGHHISEIDLNEVKRKAYEFSHGSIEYKNSLEYNYPELVKLWHPTLNIDTPDNVARAGRYKAYWVCSNCGYGLNGEWQQSVNMMNPKYTTRFCPKCRYDWVAKNVSSKKCGRKALRIDTLYPNLNKEWNGNTYNKSLIDAKQSDKGYWKCIKCNHEWKAIISGRISRETGCPKCGYNSFIDEYKHVGKKLIKGKNDILSQFPELCKEWDYAKNEIKSDEVFKSSKRDAWWKCIRCKHEWKSPVLNRTSGLTGCPNCGYNWYRAQIGDPQKIKAKYRNSDMGDN